MLKELLMALVWAPVKLLTVHSELASHKEDHRERRYVVDAHIQRIDTELRYLQRRLDLVEKHMHDGDAVA